MGLIRLLIFALLLYVAVRWIMKKIQPPSAASGKSVGDGRKLLQCACCGTWTPEDEVVWRNDYHYCSSACADQGIRGRGGSRRD